MEFLITDIFDFQMVLSEIATKEERKKEQREFGVFYDDDYDYMQHLKVSHRQYHINFQCVNLSDPPFQDKFAFESDWDAADQFLIDRDNERSQDLRSKSKDLRSRPDSSASAMLHEARFNLPKGVFETQVRGVSNSVTRTSSIYFTRMGKQCDRNWW